jgi:hypothetical protein
VFDDHTPKAGFASILVDELNRRALSVGGGESWTLGFSQPIDSKSIAAATDALINAGPDAMHFIDIEFKGALRWAKPANERLLNLLAGLPNGMSYLEKYCNDFKAGKDWRYAWSMSACALAHCRCTPFMVITTVGHVEHKRNLDTYAAENHIPALFGWPEEKDHYSAARSDIAEIVEGEWNNYRSTLFGKLWHPSSAKWFHVDDCVNRGVPHDHPGKSPPNGYEAKLRKIVDSVTRAPLGDEWEVSQNFHETLKRLVGACAKAHAGTGYGPRLNSIALLAAAWCQPTWWGDFSWPAMIGMLPDGATDEQVRTVLRAIGDDNGLCQKLDKKGGILRVEAEAGWVRLILNPTGKLRQLFEERRTRGSAGAVHGVTNALYSVWQALSVTPANPDYSRVVNINVTETSIDFFECEYQEYPSTKNAKETVDE